VLSFHWQAEEKGYSGGFMPPPAIEIVGDMAG
jgi:hypothetical protein